MIHVERGHKVLALGWFDTGKTTAMGVLGKAFPRGLAFDPTGKVAEVPGWTACRLQDLPAALTTGTHIAVEAEPSEAAVNAFCDIAAQLPGWFVFVDEIGEIVTPSKASIPAGLRRLWGRGHKHGIVVAVAAHRMTEIPAIFRGAQHLFQFRTDVPVDLDVLAGLLGREWADQLVALPPYHSLYKRTNEPPRILAPFPL